MMKLKKINDKKKVRFKMMKLKKINDKKKVR